MEPSINPVELFEGALIRQSDRDTFTAVITKLHGDLVDVVDVYGWNENLNQPLDSIKPSYLTGGYALLRMGFIRDVSSINPQYLLDTPVGRLTVFQQGEVWIMTNSHQSVPVNYAHQVQAESRRLFNFTLDVAPPGTDVQSGEEDYYLS